MQIEKELVYMEKGKMIERLIDSEEEKGILVFNLIRLNPGLTKTNFVCCMLFYTLFIFSQAAHGGLQPLIILDENYYNISEEHAGGVTSAILVIQLVVKIFASIPYGHYSDKFGRKTLITFGVVNYVIGSFIIPFQKNIFPGFVIGKILTANSACAFSVIPLLADYVADESKGKASAIAVMFFGFGALFSNLFTKLLFYLEINLGTCYLIVAVLVLFGLLINNLGLKSDYHFKKKSESNKINQEESESFIQRSKEAITIFRTNPWLKILLVLQILGSSDFMVFFTFMTIYIKSLFPKDVSIVTQNIVINNIQSLVLIPTIFGNVFYGYFLDKKNMLIRIILFSLSGGAVSFICVALSHTPYSVTLYLGAFLLGSTLPGLFVISQFLGVRYYPNDKRGIMISFTALIGYISFFIISTGGGLLYDYWRKDGPFIICTGLLLVAIVIILKMYNAMEEKNITMDETKQEAAL